MKKAELIAIVLALGAASVAVAQEAGDAYEDYFGWEDGASEDKAADDGPSSMAEAREQGRAYRLGTAAARRAASVHVVQEGDTLWDISERYFGNPWQWPELWSYNPEITNPHWIYPLDQVRLSPVQLEGDQAVAKAASSGGFTEKAATEGMLSGTEIAPSVIVPRELVTPGAIFLRDMAYLDSTSLKTVGQITAGNEEHMLLSNSDQIYVRFKSDQDVRAGQQYTIFRDIHDWERDPDEKGHLVRVQGTFVVRSYDREKRVARGVITETLEPIERGFFVAQLDRRFDLVAPKRNESTVVAHVIASVHPRELLSFGNVVFLDVGEGHGIAPGNRFFVVRRGDEYMKALGPVGTEEFGSMVEAPEYDESQLPKEVVAELRVIKVRKETTIAIVTRSDTDIFLGDIAEMRPGF